MENFRIHLVLSVSVLPSCLQPALPSGPLLSLLFLAGTIMLLPPWLEASLPNVLFFTHRAVSLFTGAACEQRCSLLQTWTTLMCWELASLAPSACQGLLLQPQCHPQVLCSQWSPFDLTPFSFFLGEIWRVCSSLQSLHIIGNPVTAGEKVSSGSTFCFQRQKRGTKGYLWGFGVFVGFLQLRGLCECSLRRSSRIWCSRFVSFSLNPSL